MNAVLLQFDDIVECLERLKNQAALEDVFKFLDWEGININGEYITHLRFVNNIVLLAERDHGEPPYNAQ